MRPDIALAAEAAAQEVRHDIDLFRRYAEHDRHQLLGAEDVLGRFIECQRAVALPDRRRGVRLHLIVVAIGGRIGLLDPDGAGRDTLVGIADRRADRPQKLWRIDGLHRHVRAEHQRPLGLVFDADQRPGMARLVERRRDHQRDRLAGVVDLVVLQRQIALPVRMEVAPGLWRRVHARHVAMGKYRQHAGRIRRGRRVDRHCPAVCYRTVDDRSMHRACDRNIGRVARAAGHLERSIGA